MRWDLIGHGPHVDLLKDVNTGDDEEDPRASGSSCEEATKTEDHRSLVFLVIITALSVVINAISVVINVISVVMIDGNHAACYPRLSGLSTLVAFWEDGPGIGSLLLILIIS